MVLDASENPDFSKHPKDLDRVKLKTLDHKNGRLWTLPIYILKLLRTVLWLGKCRLMRTPQLVVLSSCSGYLWIFIRSRLWSTEVGPFRPNTWAVARGFAWRLVCLRALWHLLLADERVEDWVRERGAPPSPAECERAQVRVSPWLVKIARAR